MLVVTALNCGVRNRELSCTQKEEIITCIPKGDKSRGLNEKKIGDQYYC